MLVGWRPSRLVRPVGGTSEVLRIRSRAISSVDGVSCLHSKLPRGSGQSKMPLGAESEDGVTAAGFVTRSGVCTPKPMLVLLL